MSSSENHPPPNKQSARLRSAAAAVAALVAFAAFAVWFFRFDLPNNPQFSRGEIWRLLPDLLLENVAPLDEAKGPPSGWSSFPQRVDLLLTAAGILAGCWGWGGFIVRRILPELDCGPSQHALGVACGLSAWSLFTLLCGLAGLLSQSLFVVVLGGGIALEGIALWRRRGERRSTGEAARPRESLMERRFLTGSWLGPLCLAAVAPFVLAMTLGAMQPPVDFDVKEYHLEGPKEHFLAGRISFLPHNVYTSFPFLTEMLSLSAMVVRGDWFRGAMAGKVVLMAFAPATALVLYAIGRKWCGAAAGWLAMLIYLSIPWVYRISIIAYAEGGLSFFLAATLLATLLAIDAIRAGRRDALRACFLAGLMAGSGVSCKYPGVLSVALPAGVAILAFGWKGTRRPEEAAPAAGKRWPRRIAAPLWFIAGSLVTFGPWMAKNAVETGNPVYPLLYSVLGGADWDATLNAKWKHGHALPLDVLTDPVRIPGDIAQRLLDIIRSDWQSVLAIGFAAIGVLLVRRRQPGLGEETPQAPSVVRGLAALAVWLFLTWWGLTHRLDRFWVPLLPVLSLLAGVGAAAVLDRLRTAAGNPEQGWGRLAASLPLAAALVPNLLYNLGFVTFWVSGPNMYLLDEQAARRLATTRSIGLVNAQGLKPSDRVLFVGEAQVFDAQFQNAYNTVFDRSLFQVWCTGVESEAAAGDLPLRSEADIRAAFRDHGITHVFVNWEEILRYREPSSYGYTDFVHPDRFDSLVKRGLLRELPLDPRQTLVKVQNLPPGYQGELRRWAPELVRDLNGVEVMAAYQWYAVLPEEDR